MHNTVPRKWIIGTIVLVILGSIYFFLNPTHTVFFPKCPFLLLTGLKCPGCGSQRAIHSLLHGDIADAAGYNFLLILTLPFLLFLLYVELRRKSHPSLYHKVHRLAYLQIYLMLILFWWIARNLYNW